MSEGNVQRRTFSLTEKPQRHRGHRTATHVATTKARRVHKGHPLILPADHADDADSLGHLSRDSALVTGSGISSIRRCPQITQMNPGRPTLPGSVRRGPGRPKTAGYHRSGNPIRKRAFVADSRTSSLRFRSAGLAPSLLHSDL